MKKNKVLLTLFLLILVVFTPLFNLNADNKQNEINSLKIQIKAMAIDEKVNLLFKREDIIENGLLQNDVFEYQINTRKVFRREKSKKIYKDILKYFKNPNNYILSSGKINVLDFKINTSLLVNEQEEMDNIQTIVNEAWFTFLDDYKQVYWVRGLKFNYTVVNPGETSSIIISPHSTDVLYYDTISKKFDNNLFLDDFIDFLAVKEHYVREAKKMTTTYNKIKYVHDRLILEKEYGKTSEMSHTPLGSLLPAYTPVCEAYAESFFIIMQNLGIPVIYVTSNTHAWNNVKIGSLWYYIDVTWDDPEGAGINHIGTKHFLTPHQNIPEHTISSNEVMPSPFTTKKFNISLELLVEIETKNNYLHNGNPQKGYEKLVIKNGLEEITSGIKLTYLNKNSNILSNIPTEIGEYKLFISYKDGEKFANKIVYFSITGKLYQLTFRYKDEVHTIENIPSGKKIKDYLPKDSDLLILGKKFVRWEPELNPNDSINSNLEFVAVHEFININFFIEDKKVTILYNKNLVNKVFLNQLLPREEDRLYNKLFMGWINKKTNQKVSDEDLHNDLNLSADYVNPGTFISMKNATFDTKTNSFKVNESFTINDLIKSSYINSYIIFDKQESKDYTALYDKTTKEIKLFYTVTNEDTKDSVKYETTVKLNKELTAQEENSLPKNFIPVFFKENKVLSFFETYWYYFIIGFVVIVAIIVISSVPKKRKE